MEKLKICNFEPGFRSNLNNISVRRYKWLYDPKHSKGKLVEINNCGLFGKYGGKTKKKKATSKKKRQKICPKTIRLKLRDLRSRSGQESMSSNINEFFFFPG
jgi:hypothetical protein